LDENWGAAKIQLSKEEIAAVRAVAEEAEKIPGTRYSDSGMSIVQKETRPLHN